MPGRWPARGIPSRRRHRRSVSAITAGLQAMGSRSTPKPSGADDEGVEAVEVVQAGSAPRPDRRPCASGPGQIGGGDLGVVLGLERHAGMRRRRRSCCGSTASRCARGTGRPGRERMRAHRGHGGFGGHAGVADAVGAGHAAMPKRAATSRAGRPPCRSRSVAGAHHPHAGRRPGERLARGSEPGRGRVITAWLSARLQRDLGAERAPRSAVEPVAKSASGCRLHGQLGLPWRLPP
jgi:hypothetical protein